MRAIIEDENAEDGVQLRVIIFIIFNILKIQKKKNSVKSIMYQYSWLSEIGFEFFSNF